MCYLSIGAFFVSYFQVSPHPSPQPVFVSAPDALGLASLPGKPSSHVSSDLPPVNTPFLRLQVACFTLTAQRQALRIRRRFFRALVSQDMTWFDQQNSGALAVSISQDIPKIQEAIGDKFGAFIQFMGRWTGHARGLCTWLIMAVFKAWRLVA